MIQRYHYCLACNKIHKSENDPAGEFILYDDHLAALAERDTEIAELKGNLAGSEKALRNCHCMESKAALDAVGLNTETMQIGKVSLKEAGND